MSDADTSQPIYPIRGTQILLRPGNGKKVLVNAPLTGAKAEAPEYRDAAPLVYYRFGDWKRQSCSR